LIALAATTFMILEQVAPGRQLPNAPDWYGRALLMDPRVRCVSLFDLRVRHWCARVAGWSRNRFAGTPYPDNVQASPGHQRAPLVGH
jgi:hypothetical protein